MENVLIVSGNQNASQVLSAFFKESFQCVPKNAESAYQAKSIFDNNPSIELAVINVPLIDESGIELADYIISDTASFCILMTKRENAEKIADRAEKNGIIVVGKPFNKSNLYQLVKTLDISVKRSYKFYSDILRLEQKIDEIQTIDKAKFMLMEHRNMTEAEAHAYLEQYAMNKRKKKSISALEIIDKINEQYL